MTKEDKELLLKDLCARLPYGVICLTEIGDGYLCSINQTIFGTEYGLNISPVKRDYFNDSEQDEVVIKPYLRPMSSMIEEERKEVEELIKAHRPSPYGIINNKGMDNLLFSVSTTSGYLTDWLSKNMFDYRGLIPMGLALEAPSNMYKTE